MPDEPDLPAVATVDPAPPRPVPPALARADLGFGVLAAIGVGGAIGSVARHELALALPRATAGFPWVTFVVNVTGSLVLAVVATLVAERWPPTRYVRPLVGVGVCGGYTTWSTFMVDTALLGRDGYPAVAVGYLAATLTLGLAATYAGLWLGRLWPAGGSVGRGRA
jgi:CrcB protein